MGGQVFFTPLEKRSKWNLFQVVYFLNSPTNMLCPLEAQKKDQNTLLYNTKTQLFHVPKSGLDIRRMA
jgi:hypothetical protein